MVPFLFAQLIPGFFDLFWQLLSLYFELFDFCVFTIQFILFLIYFVVYLYWKPLNFGHNLPKCIGILVLLLDAFKRICNLPLISENYLYMMLQLFEGLIEKSFIPLVLFLKLFNGFQKFIFLDLKIQFSLLQFIGMFFLNLFPSLF